MTKLLTVLAVVVSAVIFASCGVSAADNSESAEGVSYEVSTVETEDLKDKYSLGDEFVPANQSEILGAWIKKSAGVILLFDDDKTYTIGGGGIAVYPVCANNGSLVLGNSENAVLYLCGEELIYTDDNGSVSFERYKDKKLTAEMLDGCQTQVIKTTAPESEEEDNGSIYYDSANFYLYFTENMICRRSDVYGYDSVGSYTVDNENHTISLPSEMGFEKYRFYIAGDHLYLIGNDDCLVFYGVENKLRNMY